MNFIPTFALSLLAGALYAAGFPIKGLPTLGLPTFFGLGLLFALLAPILNDSQMPSKRKLLLIGLGFSLGHYQLGFYWIPYTLKEFGGLPPPFNFLLGLSFSAVILPQLWCFLGSILIFKSARFARFQMTTRPALMASLFTLLEAFIPQQFPAHAGHVWLAWPALTGLAPYLGAPFYSFITYYLILKLTQSQSWRSTLTPIGVTIATIVLSIALPSSWHREEAQSQMTIKLVQPNVGNFMKIASEAGDNLALNDVFERYQRLSLSGDKADLIVWPETAYPRLLQSDLLKSDKAIIPNLISDVLRLSSADLLTGGYDRNANASWTSDFETEFNTAFLFSHQNDKLLDTYHKMKLIPFGEGLPFGPLNSYLSQYITNISYFAKGSQYTLFESQNNARFITPICYEILFDSFMRRYLNAHEKRPHFILNLTNDSWYGMTSEPYQHLFLAQWRALEFQLPLVRMTNTGISSVLYPDGSESERMNLDQALARNFTIDLKETSATWYQRFGILAPLFIMVLFCGFELWQRRRIS